MPDGREVWTGWAANWYGPPDDNESKPDDTPHEMPTLKELGFEKNQHLQRYKKQMEDEFRQQAVEDNRPTGKGLNRRLWVVAEHEFTSDPDLIALATSLGRKIAMEGFVLLFDGSHTGMQGLIFDGVKDRNGHAAAIVIGESPNDGSAVHTVKAMSPLHRRNLMITAAHGFVVFPGSLIAARDALDLIMLMEKGFHSHPIGLLNRKGCFDGLCRLLDDACDQRLLQPQNRDRIFQCEDINALLDEMAWYL